MCINIIKAIDKTFDNFKPRVEYDVILVEESTDKKIKHKLTGY